MGGGIHIGNRTPVAEANFADDAEAAAIYMEDAAKCYLAARAASPSGEVALMTREQETEAVNTHKTYGQGH